MILYIDAAGRYVAKQNEAKKAGKGWHQVEVPTTDGRQALADYLNALRWSEKNMSGLTVIDDAGLVTRDQYEILTGENTKPAFSQAQVDKMFEPTERTAKLTADDVDQVCMLISEMKGAAIGHVAHELAARIERLTKDIAHD
jgi:hypothetical protein